MMNLLSKLWLVIDFTITDMIGAGLGVVGFTAFAYMSYLLFTTNIVMAIIVILLLASFVVSNVLTIFGPEDKEDDKDVQNGEA